MKDIKNKSAKQRVEEELKENKEYEYILTQQERDKLRSIIETVIQADSVGVLDCRKSLSVLIDFLNKSIRKREK